jgi:ABC-2 type transport system permease protein
LVKSLLWGIGMYLYMVGGSIRAQLQYRYAFIMNILGWAMTYAGTAVTMWVLLYSFEALGGWIFWELIFLFALAVLSWGVCMIFFFHFRSLDQYIVNGTFDRFLVRPIHPFFHFMAMKFDVGAFGQFLFSVAAMGLAYSNLHLHWTWQWLVFLGAVIGGALIQGGLLVAISSVAFWTTRSEQLYWVIMWPLKSLMNYPLSIYPRLFQLLVVFILPFAFVNYLPALILLGKASGVFAPFWGALSPLVGIIFFWLCLRFWMLGLDRYKSTGS